MGQEEQVAVASSAITLEGAPERQHNAKERLGLVTSTAMQKTITVSVTRPHEHRLYKKAIKRTKKFKAHDEENTCKVGDLVLIRETRPLSKTKRWVLVKIVKRAD